MELVKFWTQEIFRVMEALKMHRVNASDFERWKCFHSNLKQTVESWKVQYGLLFLCCALLTNQNTPFRVSYQIVMFKPYAAIMHVRLRFAFTFPLASLWIDCG